MRKINNSQVRGNNTNLIRQFLLSGAVHTKESLAAATGLSAATCRNILMEMLQTAEVEALAPGRPAGGRPPCRYRYNAGFVSWLLCRIKNVPTGKQLEILVADAAGKVVARRESGLLAVLAPDILLEFIVDAAKDFSHVGAIAVSYPGVVLDGKTSCWGDVEELNGFDLKKLIEEHTRIPVLIENDINLAAEGYLIRHPEENIRDLVYIGFPPQNLPGCGLIAEGHLLHGTRGFAGEILYIQDQTREEQWNTMNAPHGLAEMLPVVLRAVTALLDPALIVVASPDLPASEELLREKIRKMAHPDFLPELRIIPDYLPDNFAGLLNLARNSFYQRGF